MGYGYVYKPKKVSVHFLEVLVFQVFPLSGQWTKTSIVFHLFAHRKFLHWVWFARAGPVALCSWGGVPISETGDEES